MKASKGEAEGGHLFVTGRDLSAVIRNVSAGQNLRCAVAFWGKGATEDLQLPTSGKGRPRIICDIWMGGTNAAELKKLGAPNNTRLCYCDGLHAKVYLSDAGAVVGSANASDRGIGFQADAKLVEAGIFVEVDKDPQSLWSSIGRWFDHQWKGARQVDNKALQRAKELWNKRQAAAIRSGASAGGRTERISLLTLVRSNPHLFDEVGFVFASSRLSAAEKAKRFERDAAELPTRGAKSLDQFTDWDKDFERWPSRFFSFWKPKDRIYLHWYDTRVALPLDNPDTLYAQPRRWRETGHLGPLLLARRAVLEQDEPLIRRIFKRSSNRLFANGAELAAELTKLR